MDFQSIVLATLLAWTLCLLAKRCSTSNLAKKLPPGPTPLPIIGNLHHLLGGQPHKSLALLTQKYGPVMNLKLGMINTVVISSSTMAKQALQNQDLLFSSRPTLDALRAHNHNQFSIIWLPITSKWKTLRKILISAIFSDSKLDTNQQLRDTKIQELIMYCQNKSHVGEAVDLGRAAFRTTLNLLWNTIFSKDLADPYSDSAKEFKELIRKIMEEAGKPNLVDHFPFLQKFDPQGSRRRMTGYFTQGLELFNELIDERLEERKDLFVAGMDTSSSTLEWAIAELLKNPDIMAKAQAELAGVIGKGKQLREADDHMINKMQLKRYPRRHHVEAVESWKTLNSVIPSNRTCIVLRRRSDRLRSGVSSI
nr:geraniol 8-hydroxylase-like [Ipomoea trifida]